jgi:hypothetical protein
LDDEVEKLELQPVVAGRVRHALPDGELEEAADAVEVGVNPRDLGQDLSVDCTFKASGPEQASENLSDAELQDLVAFVLSNETGTGGTGGGSEPVTRSSPRTVPSTTSTASAYGVFLWA